MPIAAEHRQEGGKKVLKLFMYIVGRRDVMQITVFRRPSGDWTIDQDLF